MRKPPTVEGKLRFARKNLEQAKDILGQLEGLDVVYAIQLDRELVEVLGTLEELKAKLDQAPRGGGLR